MSSFFIKDPALISSDTGYEPYDNLTAVRGAVMWPEDLNVADEDKDSTGALLGYVSHVSLFACTLYSYYDLQGTCDSFS